MITAVDTSVLIAIAKGEADAERWTDVLAAARGEGDLVICDVVAAKFFALLLDDEKFGQSLSGLGIVSARPRSMPRGSRGASFGPTAAEAVHASIWSLIS